MSAALNVRVSYRYVGSSCLALLGHAEDPEQHLCAGTAMA